MTAGNRHAESGKRFEKARYLELLKRRRKETHVYTNYQGIGLELAELLDDPGHKALYMKLARETDHSMLLGLAHEIKERKDIRHKGAYFMRLLQLRRLAKKKI